MKIYFINLLLFSLLSCTQGGEDRISILPKDYIGHAIIIYHQIVGQEIKYSNDEARIYEIPSSHILSTKFNPDYNKTNFPKFYFESIAEKNRIPLIIDEENYSETEIKATLPSFGKKYSDDSKNIFVESSLFYVGTRREIENARKAIIEAEFF